MNSMGGGKISGASYAGLSSSSWHKSTHSGSGINCVEVAFLDRYVAVRDTRDRNGPTLAFMSPEWQAFVAATKDGEFKLLL